MNPAIRIFKAIQQNPFIEMVELIFLINGKEVSKTYGKGELNYEDIMLAVATEYPEQITSLSLVRLEYDDSQGGHHTNNLMNYPE